jgi:hypothetical protein
MTLPTYVQLYGLQRSTSGRSCDKHECCGAYVELNTVVRLKKVIILLNRELRYTIKGVVLEGGKETCTVGFTPRFYSADQLNFLDGKLCQISELFYNSNNRSKLADNRRHGGIAAGYILE